MRDANIETSNSIEDQLHNLKEDIREEYNLASQYPKKLIEIKRFLEKVEAESIQ